MDETPTYKFGTERDVKPKPIFVADSVCDATETAQCDGGSCAKVNNSVACTCPPGSQKLSTASGYKCIGISLESVYIISCIS